MNKFRWLMLVLILLVTMGMAKTAYSNVIYLPVVILDPSTTPTITSTPTPTQTPTSTPKPSGVQIDEIVQSTQIIYPLNEYVSIHNYASSAVSLTDWFIRDDNNNRYYFPDGFTLGSGSTVNLWTKDGVDTYTDLYWGSEVEVWNDTSDCAWLRDNSEGENELIDVYCYGTVNGLTEPEQH